LEPRLVWEVVLVNFMLSVVAFFRGRFSVSRQEGVMSERSDWWSRLWVVKLFVMLLCSRLRFSKT